MILFSWRLIPRQTSRDLHNGLNFQIWLCVSTGFFPNVSPPEFCTRIPCSIDICPAYNRSWFYYPNDSKCPIRIFPPSNVTMLGLDLPRPWICIWICWCVCVRVFVFTDLETGCTSVQRALLKFGKQIWKPGKWKVFKRTGL
jgi:hypothetical protein